MARHRSSAGLILIGLFKLLKGLLLVAVGIGALRLLHKISPAVTKLLDELSARGIAIHNSQFGLW